MSQIKKLKDLSSKDKVMQYLQSSKLCPTLSSSDMPTESKHTQAFSFQHRLRSCSENDSISASSLSSIVDDLSQSNSSTQSSLSDPVAHCSMISSNPSSDEDIDFNVGFDQISDDCTDDDDDDYPNNSNKNNADAITLQGENVIDIQMNEFDELYRQSSDSTICKESLDSNQDDDIVQKHATILHDSTHTLCLEEYSAPYIEEDNNEDATTGTCMRSNSFSVLNRNAKPTLLATAPKKMVRFADVLGLDLESIRYMSPPDQTASTIAQECVRLQFGQLRHGNYLLELPSIARRIHSSYSVLPSVKQYNLVSRNFTSRTTISPIIYDKQVILECLYTKDSTAYGTIRVHNCAYHKRVFIRLTDDEWNSWTDIECRHSMNYSHDNTDTFAFEIKLPKFKTDSVEIKRILFAVCFQPSQQEFWDNNDGWNYVLDVFEK
ncbi:unnamed protein product [Adineta ricciae]|uniref:CBM21 domain-containing protein n=1 Tax=Adineta ricciae TaxID=249248 RepID=A0A815EXP2_ADIRI|nr:unnamed protein product [Adineta ricciae]